MTQFSSFADMASHVGRAAASLPAGIAAALAATGEAAASQAREKMGIYQDGVGPFPAWPELASSTQIERVELGFSANEPLLRTGELRDSIGFAVNALSVTIGSPLDKAVKMELGDPGASVPARPFLGPAMWEESLRAGQRIKIAIANALTGP